MMHSGRIGTELVALMAFLFVPPAAWLLGHAPLLMEGWVVAAVAVPAVLAADAAHKWWRTR